MDRRYTIKELVDIDRLRSLFEEFSKVTGFTTGLASYPEQEMLIATGWRDICTKFHRACPASAECCKESNVYLTACLKDLKELNIKPCENGLVDGATPVIIRGVHLASLATGQVLFNKPDPEFFKARAQKFGYNTEDYLKALSKVPVVTEEQLKNALTFLSNLAVLIAEEGLSRLQIREASDDLAAEQHRLSSLLKNIPDFIYFKDKESRFMCMNDALAKRFGLRHPDEAVGKSDFDFLSEKDARRAFENEQRIIETGQPEVGDEEKEVWPDGHVAWVSTTKVPLRDANGAIEGIVGISRDITERKCMEEQLRQAQKMESIGQLAGGIAHDFNNILGATLLQINMLQEHPALTPELRSMVDDLENGANRASNLTRQLLMFSRRQAAQIKPMDLNELLDDLLKMFSRIMGEHIELKLEKENEPMWIAADKGMMEQMVVNLAVNARDAMPQGGCLSIDTRCVQIDAESPPSAPEARPGNFVRLSVADTGCGIKAHDLKHIFEPFFTTKEIGKGTGLGLATVYGIVKQHGGWIEAESAIGKGTCFRVFLPAISSPSSEESLKKLEHPQGGHETILIVEDDESLRKMLVLALTHLGYQVLQAENGMEAIRLWNECGGQIDLLIADMIMPGGISGLDLVKEFRQTNLKFKAIISSGYSPVITQMGAEAKSEFTFLPKPYQINTLATMVRKSLEQE